jgi:hypothetical protein
MRRALILLLPIFLLSPAPLPSQTRLQIGLETDSNIRETPSAALAARSMRLFVQTRKPGRGGWRSLSFQQVSALQIYWNHPEENKLVSELRFGSGGMLGPFRLDASAWGRLKLWLNDVFDYGTGGLRLDLAAPLRPGLSLTAELHLATLDYADLDGFDSRDLGFGTGLVLKNGRQRFGATLRWQRIRFDRAAVSADFSQDPIYVFLAEQQTDRLATAEIYANHTGRILARISYELQRNDSNSFGFSYWRHRVQLLLGTRLWNRMMLRLLAAGQIKRYRDALPPGAPTLPRDLDTEREQSNFLVLDLSRPLTATVNAVLRLAWYNNETPLRSRFYQKRLATLALETRF